MVRCLSHMDKGNFIAESPLLYLPMTALVTSCTYCCSCTAKYTQRSSVYNPPSVAIFGSSRRRLVSIFAQVPDVVAQENLSGSSLGQVVAKLN
jgi:hypothetical protein